MKRNACLVFLFVFLLNAPASAFDKDKWQERRTSHFLIYYKDAPEDFVNSIQEMAEYYYHEIAENLGFTRYENWSWDNRAKIYIYRDESDYRDSGEVAWSHGVASARDKTIRTFPSAFGFFDSTLPHELGHIIFREFVGFKSDIPIWFDEGVAMYQEKAKRWGVSKLVKKAMEDGKFLSVKKLTALTSVGGDDQDRDFVELFYAEAASIVYYLITEHGKFKFVNFCKQLKGGDRFERALNDAYVRFRSLDDLNRLWVDYINQQ